MTTSAGNDDTIELVLTPEQLESLSQAEELSEAPTAVPAVAGTGMIVSHRLGRWHRQPIASMAVNTLAFVAFAWWSVSRLAGQPPHPSPDMAVARPVPSALRPASLNSPQQPTVRVVNPFDASEVFEFPAGTSKDESREKVAQILLQRARERQAQGSSASQS